MNRFFFLLSVLLLSGSKAASAQLVTPHKLTTPSRVDIPMRLVNGLILVEAEVDGRRGTWILDSGAPVVILNQRAFPVVKSKGKPAEAIGVNGTIQGMSSFLVENFNWAGIRFQHEEVLTMDLSLLEKQLGQQLSQQQKEQPGKTFFLGLIGYDVLSQYAVTLDYRASQIQLRKPVKKTGDPSTPATPSETPLLTLPFWQQGHLALIEWTLAGQKFAMALDTGAQTNLIDQKSAPVFATTLRDATKYDLTGATNESRQVVSGTLPDFRLADTLLFRDQVTVFSDISHLNTDPKEKAIQGIAGYPFLCQYRTTIDYVNKQVRFTAW